jgi:hypothetical protein
MALETKQVLVTVKAYPNPSKKYTETVCCAGIDLETGSWIRLYPVPYRDLDASQKFKKYSIITVRCWKAPDDKRPESYKVDADTIEVVRRLDTRNKWKARREIVLPTVSPSFCHILAELEHDKSLGMFKPTDVAFSSKPVKVKDQQVRDACYAQLTFFDKRKDAIERIPFDFYYHFKCAGTTDCPGHKLLIIDWEIGQAFRDWRRTYKAEAVLLEKIEQRWRTLICADSNDVYFYVGNMQRFRDQFMVLGVFYPKR